MHRWCDERATFFDIDIAIDIAIAIARALPFNPARTWHVRLSLLWTAVAFLAAGIFLTPIIVGREPADSTGWRGSAAAVAGVAGARPNVRIRA